MACTQFLWVYVCINSVLFYLCDIHHLWLSQSFCLLFCIYSWSIKVGFDEYILFVTECTKYTLRIVHFRISMLIVIYCKKLFWWWLSEVLTYGYNGMPMEAILLLCFFQITQGLFLRIWGELDPQFDQSNVCNVGTFKISSYIKLCLRTSHMSIANLQYTCLSNCSCVPRPKFMMSYYCMYISIYMNNSIYNLTETI